MTDTPLPLPHVRGLSINNYSLTLIKSKSAGDRINTKVCEKGDYPEKLACCVLCLKKQQQLNKTKTFSLIFYMFGSCFRTRAVVLFLFFSFFLFFFFFLFLFFSFSVSLLMLLFCCCCCCCCWPWMDWLVDETTDWLTVDLADSSDVAEGNSKQLLEWIGWLTR